MKTKLFKIFISLSVITLCGCKRIIKDYNNAPSSNDSISTHLEDTSSQSASVEHNYSTNWLYDETNHWHNCIDEGYESLKKDEAEHQFVKSQNKSIPVTFENAGKQVNACSICKYEKETIIPKLEHKYSDEFSYDKTTHWYSCLDVGYESLKKDEAEHQFIENKNKRIEPTFETEGTRYLICSECGYEITKPINMLEHTYSDKWESDLTSHWHKCNDIGYENIKKDEAPHNYVKDESKKVEPTFEIDGKLVERCSICNFEKETIIPKLEHTYLEEWSSDENYHFHSCLDTGYETLKKDSSLHNYILVDGSLVCKDCSHESNLLVELNSDGVSYSINWMKSNEITQIIIPASIDNRPVVSIKSSAFIGRSSLTSVELLNGITSIGNSAFQGCGSLTSIVIPDSVTSIGKRAFYNCSSLTSIVLPNGVTKIEDSSFERCTSLISITIPDSVTSIGNYTFYACSSLTSIVIPNSITSIGNYTFYACSSLTSIVILDGVKSIGFNTFDNCSSLTSIVISDSVISIDEYAFKGCSSLSHIYYKGTQSQWQIISIDESNNNDITSDNLYFYSQSQPTDTTNKYWHYNTDGITPIIW